MSFALTKQVIDTTGIPVMQKSALVVLASHAREDGTNDKCPCVQTIADKAGMCAKAARCALRGLEENGWIIPLGNKAGGRKVTTNYLIVVGKLEPKTRSHMPPIEEETRHHVPPNGHDTARETRYDVPPSCETRYHSPKKAVSGTAESIPESNLEDSVASATGAVTPITPAVGLKSQLFGHCLIWLAAAAHKNPDKLRSLVGKWIAAHGEGAVLTAFVRAQQEEAVEPIGFIEKVLKAGGGRYGGETHGSKHDRLIHGLAGAFSDILDPGPEDFSRERRPSARGYH
jgi:hypothetical protein